jgi:hypothetical protein
MKLCLIVLSSNQHLLSTVAHLDVSVFMCTVCVTGSEAIAVPEGSGEAEEPGVPVVTASRVSVASSATARCVPCA